MVVHELTFGGSLGRVGRKTSETDSIKFKTSSKTPRGKKGQHKKDTIIDITSDSQMNSNFSYRWSPKLLSTRPLGFFRGVCQMIMH